MKIFEQVRIFFLSPCIHSGSMIDFEISMTFDCLLFVLKRWQTVTRSSFIDSWGARLAWETVLLLSQFSPPQGPQRESKKVKGGAKMKLETFPTLAVMAANWPGRCSPLGVGPIAFWSHDRAPSHPGVPAKSGDKRVMKRLIQSGAPHSIINKEYSQDTHQPSQSLSTINWLFACLWASVLFAKTLSVGLIRACKWPSWLSQGCQSRVASAHR